jgi:hypothetical protein
MPTNKPYVAPSIAYETLEETLDVKPKREALFIGIPKEEKISVQQLLVYTNKQNIYTKCN